MKRHPHSLTAPAPTGRSGVYVATAADDFLPLPAKSLHYRGLNLSRSSLFRLREAGEIRTKEFRVTGKLKGRSFILRESLDSSD